MTSPPRKKQALSCVFEPGLLTGVGHASGLTAHRIVTAAGIPAHLLRWSFATLWPFYYCLRARCLFVFCLCSLDVITNRLQPLCRSNSSNLKRLQLPNTIVSCCFKHLRLPRSYVHEALLSTVVGLASGQAAREAGRSRVQAVHTTARGPPDLSRWTQVARRHLPTDQLRLWDVHLPYATHVEGAVHHAAVEPHRACRIVRGGAIRRLTHVRPSHLQTHRLRGDAHQALNLNLPRSGLELCLASYYGQVATDFWQPSKVSCVAV